MAEEEEQKHEEHHEHKKEEHGEHGKKKENKLLWWGLGIGGAGLLLTLFLVGKGSNSQDQASAGGIQSLPAGLAQQPGYDASGQDYWPYLQNTSQYPGSTGTSSGTGSSGGSSSSGSSGKHKGSGSGGTHTSSGSGSHGKGTKTTGGKPTHTKITTSGGHTIVTPNPHAGGAHGHVYTTKAGDTLAKLQNQAWPGGNVNIVNYANNRQLLKKSNPGVFFGRGSIRIGQPLKPGTKINL